MYTNRQRNKWFSLSLFIFLSLVMTVSLFAQETESEEVAQILVTETGIEYEVVAWDVETIYDPTSYSWVYWETPIFETTETKRIYPVRMSEFDKAPVFSRDCVDAEDAMACTNSALADFMENMSLEYPSEAAEKRQEGLEYVTFVLDENGGFEGRPRVLSKDKPCEGCAERAVEIIMKTEKLWQPAVLEGEPVKVKLTIPVRFDLWTVSAK